MHRHFHGSLAQLGREAILAATSNAGHEPVSALFVGNMLAGQLSRQLHLGPLLAEASDNTGIEAWAVEACSCSGAAALRAGFLAVASGAHDRVAVCGVEQMTATDWNQTTEAIATAADRDTESSRGASFLSLNARIMRRYLDHHRLPDDALAPFAELAHRNAATAPHARFRAPIDRDDYRNSRVIVDPVRLYDASPICDGAAALILSSRPDSTDHRAAIRIAGSAVATDTLALDRRASLDTLAAVSESTRRALAQADLRHDDIDLIELHDAYTIMAALSLESAGFAPPGRAPEMAAAGTFERHGRLPINTFGGLKGRGHPIGATGVYQAAEAVEQLRGAAGVNQIVGARTALVQNIGGTAATVVTHVLTRHDPG